MDGVFRTLRVSNTMNPHECRPGTPPSGLRPSASNFPIHTPSSEKWLRTSQCRHYHHNHHKHPNHLLGESLRLDKHTFFLQREAAPRKDMILQELPPMHPLPPVYPRLYRPAPDVGAGQHQSRGLVMATGAAQVEASLDKAGPAHCTTYIPFHR